MHNRQEIIKNQAKFEKEIISWLKEEYNHTKRSLFDLDVPKDDEFLNEAKKKLIAKIKKVKINRDLKTVFIHEKNIYPKFYAWWDDDNKQVLILKYNNEAR